MTREELIEKGWRMAGEKKLGCGCTCQLWDHPDHQHPRYGWFTKTEAVAHQVMVEYNGKCSCSKRNGGQLRDKPLL